MKYFFSLLLCCIRFFCLSQEPKLMLPIGHTHVVNSAQFSPDGKRVVTASIDNTVKIWDAELGTLMADLKGHYNEVVCAKFSSNGKKIVTMSLDNTVKIWDTQLGNILIDLQGLKINKWLYSIQFSPDDKKVLTASSDSTVKIWDAISGTLLANLKEHSGNIKSAEFSPDGKKVISISFDKTAKIWDAVSGTLLSNFKGHTSGITSAQFSPDGRKVVTVSYDSTAKIWDAVSGTLLVNLTGNDNWVHSAQFSPDGTKVVTVAYLDKIAKIWDVNSGALLASLKGSTKYLESAHFSPDGTKIITVASLDRTARIWDVISGNLLFSLNGHKNYITSAQFSLDGKKIVTASQDRTAKIWDAISGTLLTDLKGYTNLTVAQYSPDGKRFVTISTDYKVKIWNAISGSLIANLKVDREKINSVRYSNDGKKIVTVSLDNTAKIWDASSGAFKIDLKGGNGLSNSANFSADGTKVILANSDSTAKIWDAVSGKLLTNLKGHNNIIHSAEFSLDGKKIITAALDSTAKVWDALSGILLANLQGHKDEVLSAQFSQDGKKIITASFDNTCKIWDASSGTVLLNLKGRNKGIRSAQFSPNGKKLVTVEYMDKTAKIWDALSGVLLADLSGSTDVIRSVEFSPANSDDLTGGQKILATCYDNTTKIWNVETGKLLFDLKTNNDDLSFSKFSSNGKIILTQSANHTSKFWNGETGEPLYTFFAFDSSDYLVIDKYSRYDGTKAARKLLYFTCGTEVISLDQVKDQLWVPNLAERIMKGETINSPKLSDLNICGTLPIVEAGTSTDSTIYRFTIMPQKSGLGETVLSVNDIEAHRYTTSQLIQKNGGYELIVPQKELARFFKQGEANRVTVKSFTADNSISSRGVSVISEALKKVTVVPHLYAVMVGVSNYKGEELDLEYAAKDAIDLGKAVQASAARWFGPDHVHLYNLTTDTGRTAFPEKNAIRQTLADIGIKAKPDDILLLFFAGHGVMGGKDKKQFYFLSADASNASTTDAVAQVGISTSELADWMQPTLIKAQKRILILDACNSGQAINDLVKIGNTGQGYLVSRSDDQAEQIKAIDKLNERSGLFVLAASASNQSAYEMSRYNQGLLTYALLKAIKQQPDILDNGRYLNVSRWFTAAEKTVTDLAKETGARQQPQIVTAGNFNIGLVDADVMAKIILPSEKPVFSASNFQNENKSVGGDDLELSALLNRQLQDISSRGTATDLNFIAGSNMPDALSLQGSYEVKGTKITVRANLWRAKKNIFPFEVKGSRDKLDDLVNAVITKAEEWVKKNK